MLDPAGTPLPDLVVRTLPDRARKRMRDTARYGLPVLDQESATILTAVAALRDGRMPGVSSN